MSFYVTLPSNSSMTYFPNNTCTHYMTKLQSSIQLDGAYEVALTEITLPYNWSAVTNGEFYVYNKSTGDQESIHVSWFKDQCINEVVEMINKEMISKNYPILFSYDIKSSVCYVRVPDKYGLEFIDSGGKELGFVYQYVEGTRLTNKFQGAKRILPEADKLSTIYCYTDIIDYQFVGDSYSPLLTTIAVPNNLKYGDTINHMYSQPHYVPVCRNNINIVEIDLRSDTGEKVSFKSGKVVAKLHFRPKRLF